MALINPTIQDLPQNTLFNIFSFMEKQEVGISAQVCQVWNRVASNFTNINDTLSEDPLYDIFSLLSIKDLANVATVCRHWQAISSHSSLWMRFVNQKFPLFPRIRDMNGKEHYMLNFRGTTFKKIQRYGGLIYSAWGKTIAVWSRAVPGRAGIYTMIPTHSSHQAAINSFDVRHVGLNTFLFTGSGDKTLKVWKKNIDTHTFSLWQDLETFHTTAMKGMHQYLCTGSSEGTLSLWTLNQNPEELSLLSTNRAHQLGINNILAIPKFSLFATTGRDQQIKIWKIFNHDLVQIYSLNADSHVTALGFLHTHDRSFLVAGSEKGYLNFWEKKGASFYTLPKYLAHRERINDIYASQDTEEIFTSGADKKIKKWVLREEGNWEESHVYTVKEGEASQCIVSLAINYRFEVSGLIYTLPSQLTFIGFHPRIPRLHFNRYQISVQEPKYT